MRSKIVNLYQFDELAPKAQEQARQWYRACESESFGQFGELYESAETAARILGIDFRRRDVKLFGGGKRSEPEIWWQLDGQGYGASFSAAYQYAKECARVIRQEFPEDQKLHAIADGLTTVQKRHGYKLRADISAGGRDVHEYAMSVELTDSPQFADFTVADVAARELLMLMRDFARWIHAGILEEYEYRMSDESVDEGIRANEYTFTTDGHRES